MKIFNRVCIGVVSAFARGGQCAPPAQSPLYGTNFQISILIIMKGIYAM